MQKHRRASRLDPEQRRAMLLRHAITAFARRGLSRAVHADVAREAQVAVSTVFSYFPTREKLETAVLEEVARHYANLARVAQRDPVSSGERLLDMAFAFVGSVDSHPDHAKVMLDWSTAIRDQTWPRFFVFRDKMVLQLELLVKEGQAHGTIRRNLDPQSTALLLFSAAFTILQLKFGNDTGVRVERFLLTLFAAIIGHDALGFALGNDRPDRLPVR